MGLGLLVLLIIAIVALILSKYLYQSFFSPLGLYAIVWGMLFGLYLLRLIEYDPITNSMWYAMGLSLGSFSMGSITPILAHGSVARQIMLGAKKVPFSVYRKDLTRKRLQVIILLLSFPAVLAVAGEWIIVLKEGASIGTVLQHASALRQSFVHGEIEFGVLGYLRIFAYPGAIVGGMYLAFFSFQNLLVYLPMILIVLFAIPITGRLSVIWGMSLYISAFMIASLAIGRFKVTGKMILTILSVGILTLLLFNVLWTARIGGEYSLFVEHATPGFTTAKQEVLAKTGGVGRALLGNSISFYAYATNTFAKLNAVVSSSRLKEEGLRWGEMAFAAFFRLLRKVGIIEGDFSGQLETWLVPIPAKPGTYLSQVIYDFGWIGVAILPYLFGFIASWLYIRCMLKPSFASIGLLSILYLAIIYSWHNSLFIHTVPFGALLLWLPLGRIADRRCGVLFRTNRLLVSGSGSSSHVGLDYREAK